METPKSVRKLRHNRNPTPRLSERKKGLFEGDVSKVAKDDTLEGIEFLESPKKKHEQSSVMTRSRRSIEALLSLNGHSSVISFLDDALDMDINTAVKNPPIRISARTKENDLSTSLKGSIPVSKEKNIESFAAEEYADEQLQEMFNFSMRLSYNRSQSSSSTENRSKLCLEAQKRDREDVEENLGLSPQRKMFKYTSTADELSTISTKKFYSATKARSPPTISDVPASYRRSLSPSSTNNKSSPRGRGHLDHSTRNANINRGVKHKIRRAQSHVSGRRNYRGMLASVDLDLILKNVRNEKLKKIASTRVERNQQIEKVHNIFRNSKNPIERARPLTVIAALGDSNNNKSGYSLSVDKMGQNLEKDDNDDRDFSDIEDEMEENAKLSNSDEIIPSISHQSANIEKTLADKGSETTPTNRKFFKSDRSSHSAKEVRITGNIKASVCNGKLSLISEEKKCKKIPKRRVSTCYDISDERASVEEILKNLDDTTYGDTVVDTNKAELTLSNVNQSKYSDSQSSNAHLNTEMDYSDFRKRLPYKTNDSSVIEQQHILLDFLISNNMCTEDNFTIFIADPDNHKEEAARIVDQVFVLVNEHDYFRQRLPCDTGDQTLESQQHRMLDFLIENDICTEENFDIFITNYNRRYSEAQAILEDLRNRNKGITLPISRCTFENKNNIMQPMENNNATENVPENSTHSKKVETPAQLQTPAHFSDNHEKLFPIFYTERWRPLHQQSKRNLQHTWNLGRGSNQYQIDAGQKKFGAHQCKQCGLTYSIHEPEEESLHRDYHDSVHLLRFKGWIDEDIVAIYTEWGTDGRILRITDTSHIRRHERLADILSIVDKELGYSSYLIPQTFVAYLAVRKFQIVGLCLVVPLEKANKYVRVNGVDCCTEEEYAVKCGISRLWVSPLHRRLRIASKLIQAVQQNTIFGEEIALDKIAFSAPTEDGRLFAQRVTKLENFLVYQ